MQSFLRRLASTFNPLSLLQSPETDSEAGPYIPCPTPEHINTYNDTWDSSPNTNSDVFDSLTPSPVPSVCVSETRDIFNFREFGSPTKSDISARGFEINMQKQRLTPEPETPPICNPRQRKSLISPRRLSVSLVESFGQLDIPFKPKRKSSAPVFPVLDSEAIAHLKQKYNNIKEVNYIKSYKTK